MTDLKDILGNFNPDAILGKRKYTSNEPPRIAAINAIREHGLKPPSVIPVIGKVFRFPDSQDTHGKQSAWAVYYEYVVEDGLIATCVFGSFRGDPEKVVWNSQHVEYMTASEARELNDRIAAAQKAAETLRLEEQGKAAQDCKKIWDSLPECKGTAYTQRKRITPYGARLHNGALCVPIYVGNNLTSLQYIADDGSKKFHPMGRIKGGYMRIDGGQDIYITEGYATGCSIHQATGGTVYVAFNAGNLYELCAWLRPQLLGRVVIAADDDYRSPQNAGLTKAKLAADAHGFNVVAPDFKNAERGTDFNDLAIALGDDEVMRQLAPKALTSTEVGKTQSAQSDDMEPPPGVISDIYRFYMATSGNNQPGFAIQTALAITSTMCGRYFVTDNDNMASLFFLNVGRTATGKEHCKRVVEHVMRACSLEARIAGDGFTSGAAVISLLLQKPNCITVVDEFGRYLEAAQSGKNGMQKEANTTLMEAIGRPDGVLRPKSYSTMTLTKDQIDALKDRYVYCPAITLYGLTTPSTFFSSIKVDSVLDGFLNRFLVHVSDAERAPRKRTAMIDVPQSIVNWSDRLRNVVKATNSLEMAGEMPSRKRLFFTDAAYSRQYDFECEMIELQNTLEKDGLEGLAGRANEWAMRLALCLALSRDPQAETITESDVEWSCNYLRKATLRMIDEVKNNMTANYIEEDKKLIYRMIRLHVDGIRLADLQRLKACQKFTLKQLKEYIEGLLDSEMITQESAKGTRSGRPTVLYRATGENDENTD